MKFPPVQKTIKNGAVITLREASKKDSEALLHTTSKCIIASNFLITDIGEYNPTIPEEKRHIENMSRSRNSLLLLAINNKKIIGYIELRGENRKKINHNALLGIFVLKEWRGMGVGSILLQEVITWSKQNPVLKILWLHVFANHSHAIALYLKAQFTTVGTQKNYIQNSDGSYTDNIIMMLDVK
ncbi:MAG: GNAT family N-acetyltransferase [Niabella sp.]